jgi:hypothetical protein
MRPEITVSATVQRKEATTPMRSSLLTLLSGKAYNSSRGGTRTPDPVINRHRPGAEGTPQQQQTPTKNPSTQTAVDRNRLDSATVSATAKALATQDNTLLKRLTARRRIKLPASPGQFLTWYNRNRPRVGI